ncbi:MAG: vitamin B12-dependent ribonucleotide reductase [Candidatus Zhuqueibacterota bacterium]
MKPDLKPVLSENALKVLERRYLIKDKNGKVVETPEQMFRRIAKFIASANSIYDENADLASAEELFYQAMASLEFLPNSPTLMNAGRKLGQLSACFVLPVEDSMESIFETIKHTALIHKSGGGTGFSFSRIRPNRDIVQSTKGVSSGPISFMKVFDAATEAIKQGGTRRGANMAILRVDHPDVLDFITCKQDNDALNNFNISVGITDTFMQALKNNDEYDLINPRTKLPSGRLKARDVFDKIVTMAWKNGDPGIVFLDKINLDNPTPQIGQIESTNPCGEQPLLPYESCNLGSINLSLMVENKSINFDKLRRTIRTAVLFLDNVIDKNKFPLPEIEKMTRGNRKIGLGIMGFADMLIKLGIPYNSEDAIQTARDIMKFIFQEANRQSQELAAERGPFPNYEKSVYFPDGPEYRNATRTTIAPTGTISIIAGCSSGIEPLFALSFVRNVMDDDKLLEVYPLFEQVARDEGFYSDDLMKRVAEKGSIQDFNDIPEHVRQVFITSHDISPEWHIQMQAAFQKYTDNAVSKTVNFPNDATLQDVNDAYRRAYELGCKGVTIYRDGSRDVQVLNKGKSATAPKVVTVEPIRRNRPSVLTGKTLRLRTGCGSIYITINEDEQGPIELFNTIGKAGGCAASQSEAIGRLISLAWRNGVSPDEVRKSLMGITCHKPSGLGNEKVLSCADAVSKAIGKYLNMQDDPSIYTTSGGACPECGGQIEHEGGCMVCRACGYSECG